MKRYLLLLVCCLFPSIADAYVFSDIPWTGLYSEKTDNPGGGWNPYGATSYMGGPAGTNSLGMAFQFTLNAPVDIDYLAVDALAHSSYSSDVESLSFDLNLYEGSVPYRDTGFYIPDVGHRVAGSTATFEDNGPDDRVYNDELIPFDRTLAPGTYWLARERDTSGGGIMVDDISVRFAKVHTPEPASMLLTGSGLLGLLAGRMRRRCLPAS